MVLAWVAAVPPRGRRREPVQALPAGPAAGAGGRRGAAGLPGRRQPDGDRRGHLRPGRGALPRRRADLAAAWSAARGGTALERFGVAATSSRSPSPAIFALNAIVRPAATNAVSLPPPAGAAVPRRDRPAPARSRGRNLHRPGRPAAQLPLHRPSSATPTSTASTSGRGSKRRRPPPPAPGSRRSTASGSSGSSTSCAPRRAPA